VGQFDGAIGGDWCAWKAACALVAVLACACSASPGEAKGSISAKCSAAFAAMRLQGAPFSSIPKNCLDAGGPVPTRLPHQDQQAPPEPAQCRVLEQAIEDAQKEISALGVDEIGDNSAFRAAMRASQATAQQSAIQTNLALMQQSRCSPYSHPITGHAYDSPASLCVLARTARDPGVDTACDRNTWQRSGN
jgi:hypothetical protein